MAITARHGREGPIRSGEGVSGTWRGFSWWKPALHSGGGFGDSEGAKEARDDLRARGTSPGARRVCPWAVAPAPSGQAVPRSSCSQPGRQLFPFPLPRGPPRSPLADSAFAQGWRAGGCMPLRGRRVGEGSGSGGSVRSPAWKGRGLPGPVANSASAGSSWTHCGGSVQKEDKGGQERNRQPHQVPD